MKEYVKGPFHYVSLKSVFNQGRLLRLCWWTLLFSEE